MKVSELEEAPYKGNIGFTELMMFYKSASDEQKQQLETLIEQGKNKEAWQLIQSVTGSKLHGSEFGNLDEIIRKVKGGYRLYSKKGKNLGTYPSKSGAEKRERQVQYFKHMGEAGIPRDQMPQISVKDIEGKYNYKKGTISLDKMKPVQTERLEAEYLEAVEKIESGKANPIMLDRKGRIVNGHHRYDAYKNLGYERVPAVLVDATLEELMKEYAHTVEENFAEQKAHDAIFQEILVDLLQKKYPDAEFDYQGDKVISKDGKLTVIADLQVEDGYGGVWVWDVDTGPYKGVLGTAIKQATAELLRQQPNLKPALFVDGDNQNPEAWQAIANKLNYTLLDENFADSKVKGKSRPGRVKRAGASCKGSVTDLRAKAKKYSGEKGKMYHWCANMKGGKK